MEFGDKLKKLRTDRGLSQEELAAKIFVTRTAVSKWETKNGYPSIDSLKLIANLFDVTLDELISDDDVENKRKIDDKRAKIAYAFAVAFLIATIAFAFGAYFSGYTLLCIGSFVCAAGYVIAAFLSKPRYKRFQSKNRLAYDIISKIIVIGIVVFAIVTTAVKL